MEILINYLQNNFFICSFLVGNLSINGIIIKNSTIQIEADSRIEFIENRKSKNYDNVKIVFSNNQKRNFATLTFTNWKEILPVSNQLLTINGFDFFCFASKSDSDLVVNLFPMDLSLEYIDEKQQLSRLIIKEVEKQFICYPDFPLLYENIISNVEDDDLEITQLLFKNLDQLLGLIAKRKEVSYEEFLSLINNKNFLILNCCDENGVDQKLLFHTSIMDDYTYKNHSESLKIKGFELGKSVVIIVEYKFR